MIVALPAVDAFWNWVTPPTSSAIVAFKLTIVALPAVDVSRNTVVVASGTVPTCQRW